MRIFQVLVPGIEILIITVMIYYLFSFFWNTRAMDLIYGLFAFLAIFALAKWFKLPCLRKTHALCC